MKFKTTMERELNIIPPIGYEVDRQKSTFEKIIFKKSPENPITWEDYCALTKGSPSFYARCNAVDTNCFTSEYNEFSTRERAEQFIALGRLLQLRDYWVKHSKFKDAIGVFTWNDGVIVTNECDVNDCALTFPTQEMADKFITCFRDLINKAYPLV